ncbi:hypothetical protein AB0J80_02895 [Actinoplanes sp. NPDC049548]|uniref:hypothetical protein n=1 Tax=Actinoplanes sp. NPDC049548 TaxID=3155152 RepID=UPI00344A09C5
MSTAGTVGTPGVWESVGTGLRLIVGWFSAVIGVLDLVVEMGDRLDGAYLLFNGMLVVGGAMLISLASLPGRPGTAGYLAAAGVLVAGMSISTVLTSDAACCLSALAERHGYPFTVLARDAGQSWQVDGGRLVADLLFWGYAGLVALLLVVLARRLVHRLGRPRGIGGPGRP